MNYREQLENQLWLEKRSVILKRDHYTCRSCGSKENLHIHHLNYIKGRFAWEYEDKDLVTLCRECHEKNHKDKQVSITEEDGRMLISPKKVIFFRSLLTNNDMTPSEKIVYSAYAALAMYENHEVKEEWYPFPVDHINKFYKKLQMSRETVRTALNSLRDKGIVKDNSLIHIPKSLYEQGYFELHRLEDLTGQQLIFYSFIKHKSKKYGGCIDTFRSKLAEQFGVNPYSIKQYLAKLHKMGFVRRLEDGKLMIL